MSDLSVAMMCVTVLASAALAYHAFRKHLERVGKSALDAVRAEIEEQLTNVQIASHKRDSELATDIEAMHEANRKEFEAMKSAFDRVTSREALATAAAARGPNAREY